MFPLRDDNPTLRTPIATMLIIVLNALAWVFLQGLGTEPALIESVCEFGLVPGEVLGRVRPGTRVELGPGVSCVLDPATAPWLTALTSMFMHGSWFHIIGNMWFLWVFGNNVEDVMGRGRFIAFYVICGLAAAAAQTFSNPGSTIPMVGASGAIGGVMGAYAALYPRAHVYTLIFLGFYMRTVAVPAGVMLGYWFFIQIVSGLPTIGNEAGGVAFWAHAGGFIAGIVLVFLLRDPQLLAAHRQAAQRGFRLERG